MYRHLLVAVDGFELSEKALDAAVALARALSARLSAVYVRPPYAPVILPSYPYPSYVLPEREEFERTTHETAERVLASARAKAAAVGLDCTTHAPEHEHPYRAILDTAEREGCDLIVMASHGRRGVSALLLGSETQKTLTHGRIAVLVVR